MTEKSDVYSYGVVLLELLTGKRPNDPSFGENKNIVRWVMDVITPSSEDTGACKALENLIDPRLTPFSEEVEDIKMVFNIALQCTSPLPQRRPSMRKVVDLLKGVNVQMAIQIATAPCFSTISEIAIAPCAMTV